MQQRSFLTHFMRAHLDRLDLSALFADYRAAEFSSDRFHLGIGEESRLAAAAERLHQAFSETFAS
jgi:hypothetical protein